MFLRQAKKSKKRTNNTNNKSKLWKKFVEKEKFFSNGNFCVSFEGSRKSSTRISRSSTSDATNFNENDERQNETREVKKKQIFNEKTKRKFVSFFFLQRISEKVRNGSNSTRIFATERKTIPRPNDETQREQ